MRRLTLRELDQGAPHSRKMNVNFVRGEHSALMSEDEELLPSREQLADDSWRAAVQVLAYSLLPIFEG